MAAAGSGSGAPAIADTPLSRVARQTKA